MTTPRKPLAGIVAGVGNTNHDILDQFDTAMAADDFGLLPKGTYICLAVGGQMTTAKTGTPGYTVEFKVVEGDHTARRLWMTKYFTTAALPYTKAALQKFGIDSKAKLSLPFPANRMVFKLTVTVRKDDDGTERNEVKKFEVIRVQEPEVDPFAPPAEGGGQ